MVPENKEYERPAGKTEGPAESPEQLTILLRRWSEGDAGAGDQLLPLVHDELRRIASRHLKGERRDHTLETAALVNEAYLKLTKGSASAWNDRTHFFAFAARAMRGILVDHARGHACRKRGGGAHKVPLDEAVLTSDALSTDLLSLDDALTKLTDKDPTKGRVVELRFFSGLTNQEIAELLDVSLSTVERHWRLARAWLRSALDHGE